MLKQTLMLYMYMHAYLKCSFSKPKAFFNAVCCSAMRAIEAFFLCILGIAYWRHEPFLTGYTDSPSSRLGIMYEE